MLEATFVGRRVPSRFVAAAVACSEMTRGGRNGAKRADASREWDGSPMERCVELPEERKHVTVPQVCHRVCMTHQDQLRGAPSRRSDLDSCVCCCPAGQ